MAVPAADSEAPEPDLAAEEARLARAAVAGDGNAFATLYERYERRAYNLAHRISGSEDDAADAVQDAFVNVLRRLPSLAGRELAFGSYLFTATRNATYDLMARRKRAQPSDAIPETAAPIGAAAGGGFGLDPGDPHEDPDRKLLLESQREEIRAANERLPERQREVLALRELEELSYDEIAEIMDMNRNSVAQLISRARIRLRDELRGTTLASIAASSPDCERALPLIALRDDRQLDGDGDDAAWLDGHLSDCHTCRVAIEAMQEAGTSYRAWAPLAAAPWLFDEAVAKAAELTGADWSDVIAERGARHDPSAYHVGMPPLYRAAARAGWRRRRGLWAAAGAAAVTVLALLIGVAGGDDSTVPREPAAETVEAVETAADPPPAAKPKPKAKPAKGRAKRAEPQPAETANGTPASATPPQTGGSAGPAPTTGSQPRSPAPKPKPKAQFGPRAKARPPARTPPTVTPPPPTVTPPPAPPPPVQQPPVVEDPPPTPPTPPEPPRRPTGPID